MKKYVPCTAGPENIKAMTIMSNGQALYHQPQISNILIDMALNIAKPIFNKSRIR